MRERLVSVLLDGGSLYGLAAVEGGCRLEEEPCAVWWTDWRLLRGAEKTSMI